MSKRELVWRLAEAGGMAMTNASGKSVLGRRGLGGAAGLIAHTLGRHAYVTSTVCTSG